MHTVKATIHSLTDPKRIMEEMRAILRELDPDYPAEEALYLDAIQKIQPQSPNIHTIIGLREQAIAADLLFLLWEGLHRNLECFHRPTSKLFLQLDYEDIHKEGIMQVMPVPLAAHGKADNLCNELPQESHELMETISSYYSYLQTITYKLAHYYGFLMGDQLLPYVIPGYTPDHAISICYGRELQDFLSLDINKIAA